MSDRFNFRKMNRGVSLLEVVIALALIALVAGLTAPKLIQTFGRAKSNAAKVQMQNVKAALQLFYIDVGRYPTESEGLAALTQAPQGIASWQGPYMDGFEGLTDPWGRVFVYRYPGESGSFELISLGRDGYQGGDGEDRDIQLSG